VKGREEQGLARTEVWPRRWKQRVHQKLGEEDTVEKGWASESAEAGGESGHKLSEGEGQRLGKGQRKRSGKRLRMIDRKKT
jgi:hypothetical protein